MRAANVTTTWVRPCTRVWLALMALTAVTFAVGRLEFSGTTAALSVLLIALFKGQMVSDYFMGLKRVRLMWRVILYVYLLVVGAGISTAYLLTTH